MIFIAFPSANDYVMKSRWRTLREGENLGRQKFLVIFTIIGLIFQDLAKNDFCMLKFSETAISKQGYITSSFLTIR